MSELPISQMELEKVVLISDLISKIRNYAETTSTVSDIRFTPTVKGYEIDFCYNNVPEKIIVIIRTKFIKWKILNKMRIYKYENGIYKEKFLSENNEDNTMIVNIIFK